MHQKGRIEDGGKGDERETNMNEAGVKRVGRSRYSHQFTHESRRRVGKKTFKTLKRLHFFFLTKLTNTNYLNKCAIQSQSDSELCRREQGKKKITSLIILQRQF